MSNEISIAIETSCRRGGLALARGGEPVSSARFDASARHTTQLVPRMREMLVEAGLAPDALDHVYVSVGPGSFTGLRIGITVVRTMAQLLPRLKCVAVPTHQAVARNAAGLDWDNLAVVLAAKRQTACVALFTRRDGEIIPTGPAEMVDFQRFIAEAPKPVLLIGEGMGFFPTDAPKTSIADSELWWPTAEGVHQVGWAMASLGHFTEYHKLLPNYGRKPEAVRLWQQRNGERSS